MDSFDAPTASSLLKFGAGGAPLATPPIATGFTPLDDSLGGGLRVGDLSLLAGRPGIGRTVAALQCARSAARNGIPVTFISSEHTVNALLKRLLILEARSIARSDESHLIELASRELIAIASGDTQIANISPLAEEVCERVSEYGLLLTLIGIDSTHFSFDLIELAAPTAGGLLIVDRLEARESSTTSEEIVDTTDLAFALKSIATRLGIAVLATCGTTKEGMDVRRLTISGLKDASSFEQVCDLVLIINEKARAVSNVAIAFNPAKSEEFSRQVVITIEKNRSGRAGLSLQFDKDFEFHRLDPQGSFLIEKLLSDVLSEG